MKLSGFAEMGIGVGSLPVWERGLKLLGIRLIMIRSVAPRVGAWIETRL